MQKASGEIFDLAIIGGGIAGAGALREAALRNINTILFEKNSFGSGTSSKSSRLIHGGLRYLELAWNTFKQGRFTESLKNFRFVIASLRESAVLEKIVPDLVHPLPLFIPVYRTKGQNILMIYFGAVFYGALALFCGNFRFPKILIGKKSVLRYLPNLNQKGLIGGVMIWDHLTDDRALVQKNIQSALTHGAQAYEYAELTDCTYDKKIGLYTLTVLKNNKTIRLQARKVINATGPWMDRIRPRFHEEKKTLLVPVAGIHLMLPRFTEQSVILRAQDNRLFFVVNTGHLSRVGTTERIHPDPDSLKIYDEEIEYLLAAIEKYFPGECLTYQDIVSKDAGIRPLAKSGAEKSAHAMSREHVVKVGSSGILHLIGVKLTDHRRAAEDVINRIASDLKKSNPAVLLQSKSKNTPL